MQELWSLNSMANVECFKKGFVAAILYCSSTLLGQTGSPPGQAAPSQQPPAPSSAPPWQYGGFVDFGYSLDFNHPANRVFRSRGTVWHVDELDWNMAGAYIRRKATEPSRLGVELTIQAGRDSEVFGFSATAPNLAGSK